MEIINVENLRGHNMYICNECQVIFRDPKVRWYNGFAEDESCPFCGSDNINDIGEIKDEDE